MRFWRRQRNLKRTTKVAAAVGEDCAFVVAIERGLSSEQEFLIAKVVQQETNYIAY